MGGEPVALGHVRVLDLTQSLGQYTSRLLADLGADVIKVEPPGGGRARRAWPFAGEVEDGEHSLSFLHFNTNKRSVVLDLASAEGRAGLLGMVRTADVLVEDFQPGHLAGLGLGYAELEEANPRMVITSVTPFGQTGPRAQWKADDLILQSLSDWMADVGGEAASPCGCPAEPTAQIGGAHAALATLIALRASRAAGVGQRVDVSLLETMVVSAASTPITRYSMATEIARRSGVQTNMAGVNCYPCSDGYVMMNIHFNHLWKRLVDWIGNPIIQDQYFMTMQARHDNAELADGILQEFTASMTVEEFLEGARGLGLPVARVNRFMEAVKTPQLEARGWLQDMEHPVLGRIRTPGFPWVLYDTPAAIRRPAPLLGEHSQEVLDEVAAGPAPHGTTPSGAVDGDDVPDLPLAGVRVIDFTRAWAGPLATRYLGDYGAEVIKVESGLFDTQREGRAATYTEFNRNKLSITIDLHHPEGQALIKRLATMSDVVINNFRPGTLERFNLGYEVLREVNPRIIVVSMPGYGSTGPAREYASHGAQLMANAGAYYLWGHPESPIETRGRSAFPDFMAGAQGALSVVAALHAREVTGRGQEIEVAQAEALSAALGVGFLDSLVNERDWEPLGNRSPHTAPHNVYPCSGFDEHCAISCTTDAEWAKLCEVMEQPELAQDGRFAATADRLANVKELDAIIGEWTRGYTPRQVMHILQKEGVPAAAVSSSEDVYYDVQLRERRFMMPTTDIDMGPLEMSGLSAKLSRTPGRQKMTGRPVFGGGNDYVFHELLGLSRQEREELEAAKAIA